MNNVVAKVLEIVPLDKLDVSSFFNGPKHILTHYLERNNKASDIDLRSPLLSNLTRESAVKILDDAISDFEDSDVYTYYPLEIQVNEVSAKRKITSKSIRHDYKRRLPKILSYFKPYSSCILSRSNRRILDKFVLPRVMKLLSKGRLRALKPENAVQQIKMNTQWGFPYLVRGEISFKDHLKLVLDAIASKDFTYILNLPCLLGWRGQSGVGDTSQRVVWMYPHSMSILDCMITKPLMTALSGKKEFCMLNSEFECSAYITYILRRSKLEGVPSLGFDASSFDSSIIHYILELAFTAVKYWFQSDFHYIIDVCKKFLMESSLLGMDLIKGRSSSMPSGSGFTNILDTLIQYMYFLYVCYFMKRSIDYDHFVDKCEFTGMGDDGVWFIPNLRLSSLASILKTLNVQCEPTKQTFSTNYVSFCQNIYSNDWIDCFGRCKGVRSVFRTFNSMISMERFRKGFTAKFHSVRWIVQLEDVFDNPFFPELLALTINSDKFKLGLSEPDRVNSLFKDIGGLDVFFNVLGDNFRRQKIIRENTDFNSLRIFRLIDILPYKEHYSSSLIRKIINANTNKLNRREYGNVTECNYSWIDKFLGEKFSIIT